MRLATICLLALLAASCGNSTTYILRARDSSSREKPNNLFGKILSVSQAGESELELMFGGTQVTAEWTEDATTVTTNHPTTATAYNIVCWLELDGQGDSCRRLEDACEPTAGDAVIRSQVAAAPTVIFSLDFK